MHEIKPIPVAQLLLDQYNPRLHGQYPDQRSLLEAFLSDEDLQPKIIKLAEDMAAFGVNPADLVIVTQEGASDGTFIVVEGNRRLVAVRLLQKPALGDDVLTNAMGTHLRQLASGTKFTFTELPSVVMSRDEADHWIEIRHGGEREGAGIVRWDATATNRHRNRKKEVPSFIAQVLALLGRLNVLPQWYASTPGRFPITTLERILIGKETRALFGLSVDQDGWLILLNDPAKVAAAFRPIIDDLATGAITVTDLKRKEQREEYIASAPLPPPSSTLATPIRADTVELQQPQKTSTAAAAKKKKKKTKPPTSKQVALIPKTADFNITQPRINDIYHELQTLPIEDYPNSVGILFRVFLELNIDDYINRHKPPIMSKQDQADNKKGTLARKIDAVANYLIAQQIMTKKDLVALRNLTRGDALFDSRITLMNGFVHSGSVTPKPSEMKTEFNDLTPFFRTLWP